MEYMEWNVWNEMEWNGIWNMEYGMLLYRGKIKRDLKTTI
jgi:hypothetical protein